MAIVVIREREHKLGTDMRVLELIVIVRMGASSWMASPIARAWMRSGERRAG